MLSWMSFPNWAFCQNQQVPGMSALLEEVLGGSFSHDNMVGFDVISHAKT